MSDELRCSFCQRSQREVRKLIAGPIVLICDNCIPLARAALDRRDIATSSSAFAFTDAVDAPCGFCRKRVGGRSRLRRSHPLDGVAFVGDARICTACLDLCDEIVEETIC